MKKLWPPEEKAPNGETCISLCMHACKFIFDTFQSLHNNAMVELGIFFA